MRVISGRARGLKLNSPLDDKIRPTTDRVKESMFNIIADYVYDSKVLDLFAGSGALGIESISRGADKAYFCDNNRDSIKVLKSNIEKAKFTDSSEIIMKSYDEAIKMLSEKGVRFDIIFADPPYYKGMFENILSLIDRYGILDEDGILVVEHDGKDKLENFQRLEIVKEKKYGITTLTFYKLSEGNIN